jgi:hypothetical protein
MATTCTRCDGTGFLNLHQIDDAHLSLFDDTGDHSLILTWISEHEDHDVSVCDCCGDGENWYGIPGEHYNSEDPPGPNGPYAANGGLCRCH